MFKNRPNGKNMIHGHNEKDIMALMKYIPKSNSPNGKSMVLWGILFRNGNSHAER